MDYRWLLCLSIIPTNWSTEWKSSCHDHRKVNKSGYMPIFQSQKKNAVIIFLFGRDWRNRVTLFICSPLFLPFWFMEIFCWLLLHSIQVKINPAIIIIVYISRTRNPSSDHLIVCCDILCKFILYLISCWYNLCHLL